MLHEAQQPIVLPAVKCASRAALVNLQFDTIGYSTCMAKHTDFRSFRQYLTCRKLECRHSLELAFTDVIRDPLRQQCIVSHTRAEGVM